MSGELLGIKSARLAATLRLSGAEIGRAKFRMEREGWDKSNPPVTQTPMSNYCSFRS